MGYYTSSALFFLPLALLIGGVFTQYISWRLIFWINLPLSIICLFITRKLLHPTAESLKKIQLNVPTLLAFIIAISSLVIALMEGTNLGWSSIVIKLLLANSVVFIIIYYYLERQNTNPIIDFSIFRNNAFLCAAILFFTLSTSTVLFVFSANFYQNVLEFQPALTGILFFPNVLCIMLAAPFAGKIFDKWGCRIPVLTGLLLIVLGLSLNARLVYQENYWYLLPGIIFISIGTPFVLSPMNTAALTTVPLEKKGLTSGTLSTLRQLANSINFAMLTAVVSTTYNYFLQINFSSKKAHTLAYSNALTTSAIFIAVSFIIFLFLFRKIE